MSLSLATKTIVRSWARRLGIIRWVGRARGLLPFGSRDYEAQFARALLGEVRPGDCVWDVGANLGLYTARFSDAVGSTGLVFAFEPAPGPFERVAQLGRHNVRALNVALGRESGELPMTVNADPLAATHSFVQSPDNQGGTVQVRVVAGDELVAGEGLRSPNVVKVDVEGFEEEVLAGLKV
jgi:FkbM family methyltransferase